MGNADRADIIDDDSKEMAVHDESHDDDQIKMEEHQKTITIEGAPINDATPKLTVNQSILQIYYDRLFPFDSMYKWLSYGHDQAQSVPGIDTTFFSRREFSMTLSNDVYIRFRSYTSCAQFSADIKNKCPVKIDLGAVYDAPPSQRNAINKLQCLEKEFVIDIDLTDYDSVRTCCQKTAMCAQCWRFATAAVKCLQQALTRDFGFSHLLWVYSGRRGVHCWIADDAARSLTNEQRGHLAAFLSVYEGNANSDIKVNLGAPPLHPSLQRAYDILEPEFVSLIIDGYGYLDSPDRWGHILKYLPTDGIRTNIEEEFKREQRPGSYRWKQIKATVESEIRSKKPSRDLSKWILCLPQIVFTYIYPRLDVAVSKHVNHLLKSPFCIHPSTGRVCVPIQPDRIDQFDIDRVPEVGGLHDELLSGDERTSLAPYIEYFDQSFIVPLRRSRIGAIRRAANANQHSTSF